VANEISTATGDTESFLEVVHDEESIGDDSNERQEVIPRNPRSRHKNDLFHIFHELPLPKNSPAKPIFFRFIVRATFVFDPLDYKNVVAVLSCKDVDDYEEHFFFNRDYWKLRVKMTTPPPAEHAAKVLFLREEIKEIPELKEYYSDDMEKFFINYEEKCERGYFEELSDVSLFEECGRDSDGLTLYHRKRGSSKCESFHQKLFCGVGPWSLGAKTGHHTFCNITFRYCVAAGVARNGERNFGHTHLYLVDRIQTRTQELFNVDIYPGHVNVLRFKALDFISVGIGPLSYSTDFVTQGKPHKNLKGDILFVAKQMKLEIPPLPIVSIEERQLFNTHMRDHPDATRESDWQRLATKYKLKADGKTIFPKLPQMLQKHYLTWKENQRVKELELAVKSKFVAMIKVIGSSRASATTGKSSRQALPGGSSNDDAIFVPPAVAPHRQILVLYHLNVAAKIDVHTGQCAR